MSVIAVEGLHKSYGSFKALQDVAFCIDRGEIVGFLGPNGAGKSTTMKILTGFIAPTAGSVAVCDLDVIAHPTQVRSQVGYLPESAPLYGEMTVGAYLAFIGSARGLGKAQRTRAMGRVLEECGLTQRVKQRIDTLSRGYRQRVGLAQALLHEPKLLILDEPTSGLDPNQIAQIRELIRTVGQTRTVLLSTHILSEVKATCDRAIIISDGRIVADDAVAKLISFQAGHVISVGFAAGKVVAQSAALLHQLGEIEGVLTVVETTAPREGQWFSVEAERDVCAAIYEWASARGHVLIELHAQQHQLEEVFRNLTTGIA